MPFEFKLPDVGEGITEGEIVKWLVNEGDSVKEDQPLVEVETDKAVVDLPSPRSGVVIKLHYKAGDTVKVGSTLVTLGVQGEKVTVKEPVKGKSVVGQLEEAPDEVEDKPQAQTMKGIQQSKKILASPAVRKLASEMNVDLHGMKGSGPEKRIIKTDIEKQKPEAIPQQLVPVQKKYDDHGYTERIPLKGIRKTIAINMVKSLAETAQVTAMEDVDVSQLYSIKEKEKGSLEKKGVKLTLMPFIIKAIVAALHENPILNSSIEGEEIIIKKYFNIGIAVETELGLMVPVLKNADTKSIVELAQEISALAEKARARTIKLEEMQGGTFTITNYGSIGGTYATPIINPGEAAILGTGRIFDRGKTKVLPLSLTFDHRIIDGAQAARFLESLKMFIEDPGHLMLEIT
ncbi:2-oxo acid dehydrogenase subunit E2 [Candidatus Pacearchaeota archaeon]|nr:2-oxo acid dehydrogenase subunit E2 [Candidatus Pacearchaeota archaeon]